MKLKKALVFSADSANISALCSGANLLAESSVALVLGAKSAAEELTAWADKVIWLGEKAEGAIVESYTAAIAEAVKAEGAELVIVSTGTRDRCIAAKLAVRLGAGVITDAGAVSVSDEGKVEAKRNVYGGAAEATVRAEGLSILVCAAGVFEELKAAQPGAVVEAVAIPEDCGISFISSAAKQEETVNLGAAKRVVGIGRGVGEEKNVAAAAAFAAKLGAELGGTRPIAEEAHYIARSRYIGVSGVSIRPDVYFALGVSGQVQHMVGANDSKLIVAINKDAKAPIFANCDIGLVADMNKVLPALTELF